MTVSRERTWKLEDLAEATGVSARTVRYYVQRGLLPAPAFHGRDTAYTEEHWLRLRAIRRLQDEFLPLDEIQARLSGLDREELHRIADGKEAAPPARTTHAGHAHPYRAPPTHHHAIASERVVRYRLREGLVLEVHEGADADSRALAEEIRTLCEKGKAR